MAEKLYRIGEAAKLLDVKTSVLRFWEDSFTQLAPIRTKKGQRLYRESDLAALRQIQHLLYERGLTIEGARRVLSYEENRTAKQNVYYTEISEQSPVVVAPSDDDGVLCAIADELQRLRTLLG